MNNVSARAGGSFNMSVTGAQPGGLCGGIDERCASAAASISLGEMPAVCEWSRAAKLGSRPPIEEDLGKPSSMGHG